MLSDSQSSHICGTVVLKAKDFKAIYNILSFLYYTVSHALSSLYFNSIMCFKVERDYNMDESVEIESKDMEWDNKGYKRSWITFLSTVCC